MAGLMGSLLSVFGRKARTKEPQRNRTYTGAAHGAADEVRSDKGKVRRIRRETSADERIQKEVAKEDFLLNQIDEFREKAQQLQDLLITKEHKAMELQDIVKERETKANDL